MAQLNVLPVIQIKVIGRELLDRLFAKAPERVDAALRRALRRSGNLVVKKAKLNMTANGSVNAGVARASIGLRLEGRTAIIGSLLAGKGTTRNAQGQFQSATGGASGGPVEDYTWFIEHGRKPGRMPPPQVLRQWIRRKMGVPEASVPHVEFLLRRKIARSGTRARPFLAPALSSSEAEINAIFQAEVETELKRLEGGA